MDLLLIVAGLVITFATKNKRWLILTVLGIVGSISATMATSGARVPHSTEVQGRTPRSATFRPWPPTRRSCSRCSWAIAC